MQSTRFLNVDLDLRSKSGLQELLKAFGSAVIDLKNESEGHASLEIAADQPQSIDEIILAFYNLIQALPPSKRAIWDQCEMRSFSIGIQAGTIPHSQEFSLSSKTISHLSALNAEVAITVYVV